MAVQLSSAQRFAIDHVSEYAGSHKDEALRSIREILAMSDIASHSFEEAVAIVKTHARVALHFHPDRPDSRMKSVAEALLEHGIYKSQFETQLSNGSLSAYPGGDRDLWERRLFGGAYQADGVAAGERPKYGALDLMLHPDGPAPRFGSCYFLLSPAVSRRCTFTYSDSHQGPKERGTWAEWDMILSALLQDAFFRDFAIGEKELTPRKWIEHARTRLAQPLPNRAGREPSRNLNHYIEAQVHGDVSLQDDVDALVADPSFQNTPTGHTLEQLCRRYSIALYWHMGFQLRASDVPTDFRGPAMPSLAQRVARGGMIDASAIGEAVRDLRRNPAAWSDRGTPAESLQQLKLLWHVLVRFGGAFYTSGC
ncbi:DUF3626 domain-containing protein [Cohnella zeiphila]|uniref:DUF3626 domain-containing protein n=1 Tax=Cohnella zeiphila TaxID=2761120 RepID=A0A7X0VX30_9BACL|nr:DUF3626 domain-containing protein [Cohnella zeiphila]MBB6733596.1 DUF3626 domain-containing protein [Cohnella zeiphila]